VTVARRAATAFGPPAAAVAAQSALHRVVASVPFAPFSLGDWIIRRTPGSLATAAIEHLGHNALHVLAAGTIVGALGLGAVLRHRRPGVLVSVAVAGTLIAARLDPHRPRPVPTVAAALVAGAAAGVTAIAVGGQRRPAASRPQTADPGRRQLLALLGLLGGTVVLGLADLRAALRPASSHDVRADRPARLPSDEVFSHPPPGQSPAVTPTAEHYRVSINLDDPSVSASGWRLRLTGAIERDMSWSLDDLAALPTVERLAALSCISNPVGGPLVGCSRWTGVLLADLLRPARPNAAARAVEAHGADGYFDVIPLSDAVRPGVMVAFGMNGQNLTVGHGFPARLRVPGRYGVKNVKWLQQLVVLNHDQLGYWGRRGWDAAAVVHTESRIDTPAADATVKSPFVAAGVAWAGDRRISLVEVSADDGESWAPARLEREADQLAWRRWQVALDLQPGIHPLTVRATDGQGQLQPPERTAPHPAGATGRHRVVITVAHRNGLGFGRVPLP
jgi:DMSO/TMAO reductase YedYZ molybdopterin-dependent catalytic subunit